MVDVTPPGVYFGYAQVSAYRSDHQLDGASTAALDEEQTKVHPMVMSLGRNPFYKNKKLTAVRNTVTIPLLSLIRFTLNPSVSFVFADAGDPRHAPH